MKPVIPFALLLLSVFVLNGCSKGDAKKPAPDKALAVAIDTRAKNKQKADTKQAGKP